MKSSEIFKFTDDDTISTTAKHIDDLLLTLKHDPEQAVQWFAQNQMIVTPHKFQTIILQNSKNLKHFQPVKLEIQKAKIEATNTVKLRDYYR